MKIFRDNIHGYISIPEDYIKAFVNTEIFQRLRDIEQTGMRVLYPSARHDRFIHSLGTYYLGHKAILSLRNNIKNAWRDYENKESYYDIYADSEENEMFWDKCQLLFEIACLLHDCGHAPFSHTLEFLYDEKITNEISLSDKLKEILSDEFKKDFKKNKSAPHERMSALLVCTCFIISINKLITENQFNMILDGDPIEFVARMIIGCKYSNAFTKVNQIKNCLIELLNSETIDVDSLDYIIRDTRSSGIDNMSIDVDRLLSSLTIIPITKFHEINFDNYKISADVLECDLYKTSENNCCFKGKCSGFFSSQHFIGNFAGKIDVNGNMKNENSPTIRLDSDNNGKITINGAKFSVFPSHSGNLATMEIRGSISNDVLILSGEEIQSSRTMNGTLDINAEKIEFNSTYIDGIISGKLTGSFVGNYSKIKGTKVYYTLGYNKNSLSIVENVIVARNYEYKWIYSHHKVVYYSNYLLVDLLKKGIDFLEKKIHTSKQPLKDSNMIAKLFSWKRMINDSINQSKANGVMNKILLPRPTDSDIKYIFSKCKSMDDLDKDFKEQLMEYYTRNYKVSLWKSYAEFNIFLSDFSDNEKNSIFRLFRENSNSNFESKYGYLNEKWSKEFLEFGMSDVVWVDATSKLKRFDQDKIFITFENRTLTFRTATSSVTKPISIQQTFFYIYYKPIEKKEVDAKQLCEFLKQEIQKAFNS